VASDDLHDADWPNLPVEAALSALVDLVEIHHAAGPVLDVGCGTGRTYEALMRRSALRPHGYVGLDVDPGAVMSARGRYPSADLREGDALSLPFADGAFGAVVCTDVLQHLPELDRAMGEMLRVARAHVFILFRLGPAGGLGWSDEDVIRACEAGGGEVLDFLVVDGVDHDQGIVRVRAER